MRRSMFALAAALPASFATSATAEVVPSETGGFASTHTAVVAADPAATWAMLIEPQHWWSHSWSDNSANMSLNPVAGGCFCEVIPDPAGGAPGSAEHARVVMVMPGRTLRMVGALGPLQSEGLAGTLTVTLAEVDAGTQITWDYVIGGQSRLPLGELAPVVDSVQAEFLGGLVEALGGAV
ncbi:SRPBCC family protein [Alteraurantiacibacter aquimixticola]|uniref:ATPase n=1 Tax=Alteraurantiacibacter aquimixticola TaxID=2489173 RepID=A0A4T3F066_9SPHN|nr:SRPBCC family protein [Alteraurantiacibacter aquimixticola]TIX50419.1 ATPase [Alteraurantiacibacter aquimixticola]